MTPEEAASIIQRKFRKRIYRFHRGRFIERLELEIHLGIMGLRFWVYAIIFLLFCVILKFPSDSDGDLLIARQLNHSLHLDSLAIKSRDELKTSFTDILDTVEEKFKSSSNLADLYVMTSSVFAVQTSEAAEPCLDTVEFEANENSVCPDFCEMSGCPPVTNPVGSAYGDLLLYAAVDSSEIPDLKFFDKLKTSFTFFAPFLGGHSHLGVLEMEISSEFIFSYEMYYVDRISDQSRYAAAVTFAFLFVFSQILFDIWYIVRVRSFVNKRAYSTASHVAELVILVTLLVFLCCHVSEWRSSEADLKTQTRKLGMSMTTVEEYEYMQDLVYTSKRQSVLRSFGFACLYLVLVRLSQSMLMHPRIALFVRTFTRAKSEISHFFVTATFLFMGLGMIGYTTQNAVDKNYTTFRKTMWTQFTTVAASSLVSDYWMEHPVYHVMFSLLVLLCLLNFFTAVIIDTYLKLREAVEKQITEQSIFMDLVDSAKLQYLFFQFEFPSRRSVVEKVRRMKALKTVTLANLLNTNLFKDAETCRKFCAAYRRFQFLHVFEFQAPQDVAHNRWVKALERLDDFAVDAHLDVEVMEEYDLELVRRLDKVERAVDAVTQFVAETSGGASASTVARQQKHAVSTFMRKKRNLFDEFRVRRETVKKVKNILNEKRIKDYMFEASTDGAIKYLVEKKLKKLKRQSTFKPSTRRRTLTNSQRQQ